MGILLVYLLVIGITKTTETVDTPKTTTRKSSVLTITLKTTPPPRKATSTARKTTTAPKSVEFSNSSLDEFYKNSTVEEELSACELNSTCSFTTEAPIELYPDNIPEKDLDIKTLRSKNFCTCDLQLDFCDINCCCDESCSAEDKTVFDHCATEHLHYDTRYCDYMKYIYINNTPFEWHVNQNGLFCVLKNNLPPSYIVQKKHPISSYLKANEEINNKFTWPRYTTTTTNFTASQEFKYKSNIWTVDRNGIQKFKLPNKFITTRCLIMEDVQNLVNTNRECNVAELSEENPNLSLKNYFVDKFILASPKFVNLTKYKHGIFQDCPRNVCLPIIPKICDRSFQKCKPIANNDSSVNVTCNFDLKSRTNNCKNIVKKVQYHFYHGGSKGFARIELLVHLETFSYDFDGHNLEYSQEFSVNFWWVNQTRNFSAILSGSPGYLTGKPILTGTLINVGNETQPNFKIQRSPSDYLDNFLTLPTNLKGMCILNQESYTPVEFGYNFLTKCKLRGSLFYSKTKVDGNEICRNIQRIILNSWDISNRNKTIAMFGDADSNHSEQWLGILYDKPPLTAMNKTVGTYFPKNNTVLCSNLVSNLDIGIFHSKLDLRNLKNQEKILAVTYTLGNFVFKSFTHTKNITNFEIELSNRVVFYDVTGTKDRRIVDPPTFDIKLPYDFFYPFVKVNSAFNIDSNSLICIIFVTILVLM